MADELLRKLSLGDDTPPPEENPSVQKSKRSISFGRRRREIYLNDVPPKKGNLFLGILFLLLIVIAVFWGLSKASRQRSLSSYESVLIQAQRDLDESVGLADLNLTRAKELALSSKKTAEELTSRGIKDDRLKKLQISLSSNLPKILGEYTINPSILIDLGLAKEGFSTTAASTTGERILVLDRQMHVILTFDFEGGSMQALAGADMIPEARLIATDGRVALVLDGLRIARITIENQPSVRSLVLPEGNWGRILTMGTYGGSLYLVDDVKNQIWKYSSSVERIGEGEPWLNPSTPDGRSGQETSLDGTISIAIDGSLWLLDREGEIDRFVQGKEVAFRISELEKGLADPKVIVTDQDSQNLYVLDSGNRRIVVVGKDGKYKSQYIWDKLGEASSIAVSEEKKKILIFLGPKVYETELKM
ncbi:hypothetical protein HYZ78_01975 [Candidatus Microgenomates bacterium]|nr:hypothetical protein [Candidatus Microgenomates bacterium]